MIQKKRRNRRKQSQKFKPDRQYIEQAVSDYLEHGGKINKIESTERSFSEFMSNGSGNDDTDTFLNGGA